MTVVLRAARLALPVLFFGYAVVANLSLALSPPPAFALPDSGLLSGGMTRGLDDAYRQDLAHMDLSFGVIGAARFALLGEARGGAIVGRDGWLFTAEEMRPAPDDAGLAHIAGIVQAICDQLLAEGVALAVVPLPAKIDLYRSLGPDPALGQAQEDLLRRFADGLAARGIAVVDARAALLTHPGGPPAFYTTDTHWTPQGAARVAGAVAISGYLKRGPLVFDRQPAGMRALTGDLVRFVTTPGIAPHLGLAPETLRPFVQTEMGAADDIFGAAPADIVLIGTSYSANPDWGFADALMVSLGRDVINMAAQGQGPLQPMRDYLAGDAFRDTPPAAVIWEIPVRHLTDPAIWSGVASAVPSDMAFAPSQKENPDE